jgi:hypothetical protein
MAAATVVATLLLIAAAAGSGDVPGGVSIMALGDSLT